MSKSDNPKDLPVPAEPRPGKVTKGHAKWKRGVGRDGTDYRNHGYTAKGGPITRTKLEHGFFADGRLMEVSIVRCCDDVTPGKMCPHGVWGYTKIESP